MLEKTYAPAEIEPRIHADWESAGAFKAGRPDKKDAEPYCIVIPPPNVTGSLHMGHALNNSLQDILCRFERMRGKDVLWQPGTDHAGIATQLVVTRQLAEKQINYRDLGRDAFIEKVWEWKAQSGGTIQNQLKRLGASCDWSRERFTMDEGLSQAVLKVFVDLYNQGLIYKDKRLVNWDPAFQSAVSDLEVEPREHTGKFKWSRSEVDKEGNPVAFDVAALTKVLDRDPNGHMYTIRYPLAGATYDANDPATYLMVGTTRPETMLGDTGVAIHPDNERLKHLIGKRCILPLVDKEIPIVGDTYADPEKGTGAVKITPAHDFNDWEVGKRAGLEVVNILDATGKIIDGPSTAAGRVRFPVPGKPSLEQAHPDGSSDLSHFERIPVAYRGLDRFDARKKVVEDLAAAGLLEKVEPHTHAVPHAQRGDAVIEPWLTYQWYVDAATLAKPALQAVRDGKTRFVPEKYANDYFRWLENIQPWCISRQLWWGHQIPAWYGPDGKTFVANDEAAAQAAATKHYGNTVEMTRDPDVLDTWFSSGLWAFSTLGWPEQTKELKRYYPTSCLVTGFDIIFFWVARMMMQSIHFMGEVPFRDVYIHGLVRDEKGRKMSKSIGNVIDPLELIDKYGADALRFTLAALTTQGRDVKLTTQRVEGYRNFATKLWNAARFSEMNECVLNPDFDPRTCEQTINRWIAGEVERVTNAVTEALEAYRFNEAAGSVYQFVWGIFCDWYLELSKPILNGNDEEAKAETRAMTAWVLDETLKLLHPFMPFVTEELWARLGEHCGGRAGLLTLSPWPAHEGLQDADADAEIRWVVKLVDEVRSVRSEMNVPAGAKVPLVLVDAGDVTRARAERHEETIKRLARLDSLMNAATQPKGSAPIVVEDTTIALPLAGLIDLAAEEMRLAREIKKETDELAKSRAKLSNAQFLAKAPEAVVEEMRERLAEGEGRLKKLEAALKRLQEAA